MIHQIYSFGGFLNESRTQFYLDFHYKPQSHTPVCSCYSQHEHSVALCTPSSISTFCAYEWYGTSNVYLNGYGRYTYFKLKHFS